MQGTCEALERGMEAGRRQRWGRTDEDGRGPEVLDGEALGAEGKEPGEVGRAVTVGAEGRVHKALVQHQACNTTRACQLYPLVDFLPDYIGVHSPLTYTLNPE